MSVTFRDFAGAVMANDQGRAAAVLAELLNLNADQSSAAATYFFGQMSAGGPAFMGKAMGLRTAVESGSTDATRSLLGECFGLTGEAAETAVTKLTAK